MLVLYCYQQENMFSVGDIVRIMDSAEKVEAFQRGHGGLVDAMKKVCLLLKYLTF